MTSKEQSLVLIDKDDFAISSANCDETTEPPIVAVSI